MGNVRRTRPIVVVSTDIQHQLIVLQRLTVYQREHKKNEKQRDNKIKDLKKRLINGETHNCAHCWQILNSELRIAEDPQTFNSWYSDLNGAPMMEKSDFRLMMGGGIMTRRISWLVVSFSCGKSDKLFFLSSFLSAFCCLELNTQMSAFTPPSPPRRLLKAGVKDVRADGVRRDPGPSLRLSDLFPCDVFISLIRIAVAEAFPLTSGGPVKRRSCAVFLRIHASSLDQQFSYATIKVVVNTRYAMLSCCIHIRKKNKRINYQLVLQKNIIYSYRENSLMAVMMFYAAAGRCSSLWGVFFTQHTDLIKHRRKSNCGSFRHLLQKLWLQSASSLCYFL